MYAIGDYVEVRGVGYRGVIDYIDFPSLYHLWAYPVQLILDKPYDDTGHRLYRTAIFDLFKVKRNQIDHDLIARARKEIRAFLKTNH